MNLIMVGTYLTLQMTTEEVERVLSECPIDDLIFEMSDDGSLLEIFAYDDVKIQTTDNRIYQIETLERLNELEEQLELGEHGILIEETEDFKMVTVQFNDYYEMSLEFNKN